MHLTSLALAGFVAGFATANYTLLDGYDLPSFFSNFDFFTDSDPTQGYVNYVDQSAAYNGGLISFDKDQIYIGVDSTNTASGRGRDSVRLTSTASYNHGLFILDIEHMPGSICGTWPAFWLVGPDWPNYGEIDIIEGVNDQTNNAMTLHTSGGCTISNNVTFTGNLATDNCWINALGQPNNAGCGIQNQDTRSYGSGLNSIGGGVYATEWTSKAISIWFFTRGNIPEDISTGTPDPTSWGAPVARFQGACNIDDHFKDQHIVFDTTFCGDWAGAVFSTSPTCSTLAPSCIDYVRDNPSAFADAYWLINSLKVYQSDGVEEPVNNSSSVLRVAKNQTLPLGVQVPKAMGSGVPVEKRRLG